MNDTRRYSPLKTSCSASLCLSVLCLTSFLIWPFFFPAFLLLPAFETLASKASALTCGWSQANKTWLRRMILFGYCGKKNCRCWTALSCPVLCCSFQSCLKLCLALLCSFLFAPAFFPSHHVLILLVCSPQFCCVLRSPAVISSRQLSSLYIFHIYILSPVILLLLISSCRCCFPPLWCDFRELKLTHKRPCNVHTKKKKEKHRSEFCGP